MDFPVETQRIEKAVRALVKFTKKEESLLNENEFISVVITTAKIPERPSVKPIAILLETPLTDENAEVCVFVKDPQRETKDLFAKESIKAKVIGISKLRKKYKAFEQKRLLCASYDLFLADSRVIEMLPKLLGKAFFTKKKQPFAIDMKKPKQELERLRKSTFMVRPKGTCLSINAGTISFTTKQNAQNIKMVIEGAVEKIPGKWGNITSIHVKTNRSTALPIYVALPETNE